MEWEQKAGEPDKKVHIIETSDGAAVLIIDHPDYVIVPPELGGGRANVLEARYMVCPVTGRLVPHYKLDKVIDGKHLYVAKSDQFYWHLRGESDG